MRGLRCLVCVGLVAALCVVGCLGVDEGHAARGLLEKEGVLNSERSVEENGGDREKEEKVSGRCVCIFDFDSTLRVQNETGWDVGSKDAAEIVRKCKNMGYEVALASANCDEAKMRFILPNRIDDDIFTDHWFETPAFQHCEPEKTKELTAILKYFNTHPQCAMFFDDLRHNVERYGKEVGVNWRLVDEEIGVTWDDYWGIHWRLEERCNCMAARFSELAG